VFNNPEIIDYTSDYLIIDLIDKEKVLEKAPNL